MSGAADLLIVGAGAAGLTAAIQAARTSPGLDILIVERSRRPGAKLLVSGGGRCNICNTRARSTDFSSASPGVVSAVLRQFSAPDSRGLFASLGLALAEEGQGKLYPASRRADDVLDCLMREVERLGVRWRKGEQVMEIVPRGIGFQVRTSEAELEARRVILAAGGMSLPKSGSDGSGLRLARALGLRLVEPCVPSLSALRLPPEHPLLDLAGVTCPVTLRLAPAGGATRRWTGELLITHFGLSGPVVLDISRHVLLQRELEGRAGLLVDWLPALREEELRRRLSAPDGERLVAACLRQWLPGRLALALLDLAGLPAGQVRSQVSRVAREHLLRQVKACLLPVEGARSWHHAECTAGGVSLDELEPASLEARALPGLHVCGELCDVDGRLGGFNFQWAWSSGTVAGRAAARALQPSAGSRAG